jgi:hypothetical protein
MKNCQHLESIYDDGQVTENFESINDIIKFLEDWRDNGIKPRTPQQKKKLDEWLTENVYANCKDTVSGYEKTILAALKDEK